MDGMELREMDKIIYPVYRLCWDHERSDFIEGVKIGVYFSLTDALTAGGFLYTIKGTAYRSMLRLRMGLFVFNKIYIHIAMNLNSAR